MSSRLFDPDLNPQQPDLPVFMSIKKKGRTRASMIVGHEGLGLVVWVAPGSQKEEKRLHDFGIHQKARGKGCEQTWLILPNIGRERLHLCAPHNLGSQADLRLCSFNRKNRGYRIQVAD